MTRKLSCEQVRSMAHEMAMGTISGDERAQVLAHVSSCLDCRRLIESLSETADALLLLTPEHEPPAGFESNVLSRMRRPATSQLRRALWVAAAIVVAGIASGLTLWSTAEERELGSHYAHELREANGTYFGVKPLVDPAGTEIGDVFLYTGQTDWVFVVFDGEVAPGRFEVDVKTKDAGIVSVDSFELGGGRLTWGRDLTVDPRSVVALRLHGPDGTVLVADFR